MCFKARYALGLVLGSTVWVCVQFFDVFKTLCGLGLVLESTVWVRVLFTDMLRSWRAGLGSMIRI